MCSRYKYNPNGFDSGGWGFNTSGRAVAEYLLEQLAKVGIRPSNPSTFLVEKDLVEPGDGTEQNTDWEQQSGESTEQKGQGAELVDIFPESMAKILLLDPERGRLVVPSSYGLLPLWLARKKEAEGKKLKPLYNCRDDSLTGEYMKPAFKDAFFRRRCIANVAIIEEAMGNYQWLQVRPSTDEPFYLASLFDFPHKYAEYFTHCFVTTGPNAKVEEFHDRMPVILDRAGAEIWLNPKSTKEQLVQLLKPAPVEWIGEITIRQDEPPKRRRKLEKPETFGFDFEE